MIVFKFKNQGHFNVMFFSETERSNEEKREKC